MSKKNVCHGLYSTGPALIIVSYDNDTNNNNKRTVFVLRDVCMKSGTRVLPPENNWRTTSTTAQPPLTEWLTGKRRNSPPPSRSNAFVRLCVASSSSFYLARAHVVGFRTIRGCHLSSRARTRLCWPRTLRNTSRSLWQVGGACTMHAHFTISTCGNV